MYRFFVEEGQIGQGEAVITGGDVNHIRNVLRMRPGDKVMVSDGKERDYCCRLKEIGCDRVIADILEEKPAETELPARLYLFQGLPKSDKMELIIQKATELGVYELVPMVTGRTVVKLDEKKAKSKAQRWQGIAQAAAKQSKRGIVPRIHEVMSFGEAGQFMEKLTDMLQFLIPNYVKEGKYRLVVAIGCTGGKHRSVTLANELYRRMKDKGKYGLKLYHRDVVFQSAIDTGAASS